MENMKRAISALMALVLVLGMLPGVPMVAGAEETEPQHETVAVETTEAAETAAACEETSAETTAEPETVPEETWTEETAEPVPTETEATEETAPEETEATEETAAEEAEATEQTVPGETVEAVEELTASEEAADGEIVQEKLVEKLVVGASSQYTYVGDRVQLTAAVTPADAEYPEVEFYVVEGGAYEEDVLKEKGILIAKEAGTFLLAARALDEGGHDSATQEADGTVEVTFVDYAMQINRKDIDEDHLYEDGTLRVMTGEKLALSVHFLVNGVVELPVAKTDVTWTLREGDEKYVSLTPSSDGKEVTVTAKTVTDTKVVRLYVEDTAAGKDYIDICVYPVPYKVGIYRGEEECTGDTVLVPILASSFEDPEFTYYELNLTALVWPEEAEEPMVWTCSDGYVEVKHPIKEGTEDEEDTTCATVRVYPYEGKSTITVTSKNYPDVKSKITVERKWCLEQDDIRFSAETKRLSTDGEGLISGQSAQLVALDCRDEENLETLDPTDVKWSLSQEDQVYASISEEGKLTARKGITAGKEIVVRCEVIGNEENAFLELPVIIRPLGTEVRILAGELGEDTSPRTVLDMNEILNGKTVAVDTADGCDPFRLKAVVMPDDEACGASQKVKWTTSDKTVAAIDPDTDDIVWKGKTGTVTVTATAQDGSGKKAAVKLKFGVQVRNIEIPQDENFFLRSGQSWTFRVRFNQDVQPTDKSVTWALVGENDSKYASVSSTGKLTAKTVYEEHTVTLRATAKDGSGVWGETQVAIRPKSDSILTLKKLENGEQIYVTKTTQTVALDETVDLEAWLLYGDCAEYVKWVSSNSKIARVSDVYGTGTTVEFLKTGTVTLTAVTTDGTNKKAVVTFKVVRMTDRIELTQKNDQTELACGKSLTLTAKSYDIDDKTPTVSKLSWSIAPGGEQYAKVSSGKVTAITGALSAYDEPVTVTVVVKATDGSGVEESYDITVHPIAQSVLMYLTDEDVSEYNITGRSYTYVMEQPGADVISMTAQVWSENAIQGVTWKSSNSKIASIDKETGLITCNKAGTVTITATAVDGSAKKASFKLTLVLRPTDITFEKPVYPVVAGGKSLTLKPVLLDGNGNKVSGKTLEWDVLPVEGVEDGTAYVTSFTGGVLRTKKVTEPKIVKITVQTVEKNEAWESELFAFYVYICPATESVKITKADGTVAGSTMWAWLEDGGTTLGALTEGKSGEEVFPYVTWKSSNKKIAEVDNDGNIIFHTTGTVTLTATAADGTGKYDTIKLVIKK